MSKKFPFVHNYEEQHRQLYKMGTVNTGHMLFANAITGYCGEFKKPVFTCIVKGTIIVREQVH